MKLKVTNVRTILNRLHYRGITNYDKTRDKQTGWYYYVWTFDVQRMVKLVIEEQSEEISFLEKKKLEIQEYSLFGCANCDSVPFEVAMEYNFKCPNCGKTMESINQDLQKKKINKEINMLKKDKKDLETLVKKIK